MAFALLKNVLGTGTNIKRGNLNGKLGKALAKIEGNAAAGGFNFSYRDTGLAGAIITCEAGIAGHVSKETIYLHHNFNLHVCVSVRCTSVFYHISSSRMCCYS